jgi:preprotein translocase subunit YajC
MKYIAFALASTMLMAAPSVAQTGTSPAAATPAAPATPSVTAGAQVADASGGAVGTIESVSGGNAVLSTGTAKATLPLTAFAQGQNGTLVIGMTKAQVEAAVAQAGGGAKSASSATGAPAGQTALTAPSSITVGATVNDTKGGVVGKVAAVSGDLVTVETANAKAQLPKTAFAQGENGLVIAMTASELEAAAKGAGGPKKTGA